MSIETYEPQQIPAFGGGVTLNDRGRLPLGVAAGLPKNVEFIPGELRTRRGVDFHKKYLASGVVSPTMDFAFAYRPDRTQYSYLGVADATLNRFRVDVCDPASGTIIATSMYGNASTPYRVLFKAYNDLTFYAIRNGANAEAGPGKWIFRGDLSVANPAPYNTRASSYPPQTNGAYANSGTVGTVSAGDHYFVVIFENTAGHRTAPMAAPVKLTATGGFKVDASALPIGPGGGGGLLIDIAKRLIFATSANPALGPNQFPLTGYYCLETSTSGMVVGDDFTTTATINFTDATLVNGTPIEQYLDNTPLPPCKGFTVYNQRLVAWGVRNALYPSGLSALQTSPTPAPGVFNVPLSVDSGTTVASAPAGWTTVSAGGGWAPYDSNAPGSFWQMSGDGATLTRGKIRTNGDLFYGLTKWREYRIRFKARLEPAASLGTGTLDISVTGASPLISIASAALLYPNSQYFDYKLVASTDTLAAGAYLNVGLNNTAAAGSGACISDIMIYPSDTPFYGNTPWVSKAGQPEAFSNLTGFLGISDASTAQSVQSCFVLRTGLYMARETSIFGTTDNKSEPSDWTISQADATFGACGPKAVALINDTGSAGTPGVGYSAGMALMVCRNGITLFDGSSAEKISQEIEPTLARVNWDYGHLVWATAEPARKKVFIGLPVDGSTVVNFGLVVDYQDGWGDPMATPGTGRKWAEWTVGTQAGLGNFGTVDPADSRIVFCSNQGGTAINLVKWPSLTPHYYDYNDGTNLNIPTKYVTAVVPGGAWGLYNYGGVSLNMNGTGNLVLSAVLPNDSLLAIPRSGTPRVLTPLAPHDIYIKDNIVSEPISLDIRNGSAVGDYFAATAVTVLAKRSPFTPVRGI